MSTYNQVLTQAKNLSSDDQLRLLSELAMQLRDGIGPRSQFGKIGKIARYREK